MQLSNLTIYFDNLSTRSSSNKYDNYAFDFMIVWPMQSVTKNPEEIQMLHEMAEPVSYTHLVNSNTAASICLLKIQFSDLDYHF